MMGDSEKARRIAEILFPFFTRAEAKETCSARIVEEED
jgi:hypothetical protein